MTAQWDGMDRRKRPRWRLNKEVSVPDILAILAAVVGALSVYYAVDKRVALVEQTLAQIAVDQSRQDVERTTIKTEIRDNFNRVNDKLDRLIERGRPER